MNAYLARDVIKECVDEGFYYLFHSAVLAQ
jgi:hypothetical protein